MDQNQNYKDHGPVLRLNDNNQEDVTIPSETESSDGPTEETNNVSDKKQEWEQIYQQSSVSVEDELLNPVISPEEESVANKALPSTQTESRNLKKGRMIKFPPEHVGLPAAEDWKDVPPGRASLQMALCYFCVNDNYLKNFFSSTSPESVTSNQWNLDFSERCRCMWESFNHHISQYHSYMRSDPNTAKDTPKEIRYTTCLNFLFEAVRLHCLDNTCNIEVYPEPRLSVYEEGRDPEPFFADFAIMKNDGSFAMLMEVKMKLHKDGKIESSKPDQKAFGQLVQEAALAWRSGKFTDNILLTLVSDRVWHFFYVRVVKTLPVLRFQLDRHHTILVNDDANSYQPVVEELCYFCNNNV